MKASTFSRSTPTSTLTSRLARGALAVGLATLMATVPAAHPASAESDGAEVTSGAFHTFSVGTGLPISGEARMVRTADGQTIAGVHLEGLVAGATYAVHVHAGDCATNASGGGHYFFPAAVPSGDGPAGDEIWPGPVVATGGGTANGRAMVGATAGASAASVVVHRSTAAPNKIACADLA